MDTPLVQTKIYVPRRRSELVARPHLLERLQKGLTTTKLTIVSAPAGYGKTTLLCDLAAQMNNQDNLLEGPNDFRLSWLSLDADDNDPVRFWTGIVTSIQVVAPQLGEDSLSALHTHLQKSNPQQANHPFLVQLINELVSYLKEVSHTLVLVLDDYHTINHPAIHSGIGYLLDYLPQHMHLIISTRSDPPLQLARMRGSGEINELRMNDLRFSPSEVSEFLFMALGYRLSPDDVSALTNRTEGWAAGLQMTAITLRDQPDISVYINSLESKPPYILDYLLEEILLRQPEPIKKFLLCTSILENMCAPLCDALMQSFSEETHPISSQQILEHLFRTNLFIIPLDSEREWFRYHHLFAALLQQNLQKSHPGLLPDLHTRASAWYKSKHYRNEAVRHAFSSGFYDQAAKLIREYAQETLMHSEIITFLNWVDALPESILQENPLLLLYRTAMLLLSGGPVEEAEAALININQVDAQGELRGELNAVRAMIAAYRGELRRSMALAQQATEQISEENLFLKSFIAGLLGLNALIHGSNASDAERALDDAFQLGLRSGNIISAIVALVHQGEIAIYRGQLDRAEVIFQKAHQLAVDRKGQPLPVAGLAYAGLGTLLRLRGKFDDALENLENAILLNKRWSPIASINAYLDKSRIFRVRNDFHAAAININAARELSQKFDAMIYDDLIVQIEQANLWIVQGQIQAVQAWVQESQLLIEHSTPMENIGNYVRLIGASQHQALARMHLRKKQPDLALKISVNCLKFLKNTDLSMLELEFLCLQALAYWQKLDRRQAAAVLHHALSLAEPQRIIFPFLEGGVAMRQLLLSNQEDMQAESSVSHIQHLNFVTRLLVALGETQTEHPPAVHPTENAMVEPLSKRELAVLALVAKGYSNKEIAQTLIISLHTVKWHLGNIFSKLGVKNRSQAVANARKLRLLMD